MPSVPSCRRRMPHPVHVQARGAPRPPRAAGGIGRCRRQDDDPRRSACVWIAVLASFVAFLDGTVVNVALPAISRELGGGLDDAAVGGRRVPDHAQRAHPASRDRSSDAYGRMLVMRIGLDRLRHRIDRDRRGARSPQFLDRRPRGCRARPARSLVPELARADHLDVRGAAQARAIGIWTAMTTARDDRRPARRRALRRLPRRGASCSSSTSFPIAITLWLLARLEHARHPPPRRIDRLARSGACAPSASAPPCSR